MPYKIVFKKSVMKDLRDLAKKDLRRIMERIKLLEEDPRPQGCEKLSGDSKYCIRQGDYRILYEVQDKNITVVVVRVGHRKEVYKKIM